MTDAVQIYELGKNIAAFTGDREIARHPKQICELAAEAMNIRDESEGTLTQRDIKVVRPHQVHGTETVLIDRRYFHLPQTVKDMLVEGKDAIMTQKKYVVVGVSTADCIPVIVYDPEHHAAIAIHAGWRGTVNNIIRRALKKLHYAFKADRSKCRAVIGPGIGYDSFEVGQEVYDKFAAAGLVDDAVAKLMPDMHPSEDDPEPAMKWHLDLKEIIRRQLMDNELLAENITVSSIDTYTDERFYSARREQTGDEKCGRNFTGFMLQ